MSCELFSHFTKTQKLIKKIVYKKSPQAWGSNKKFKQINSHKIALFKSSALRRNGSVSNDGKSVHPSTQIYLFASKTFHLNSLCLLPAKDTHESEKWAKKSFSIFFPDSAKKRKKRIGRSERKEKIHFNQFLSKSSLKSWKKKTFLSMWESDIPCVYFLVNLIL